MWAYSGYILRFVRYTLVKVEYAGVYIVVNMNGNHLWAPTNRFLLVYLQGIARDGFMVAKSRDRNG